MEQAPVACIVGRAKLIGFDCEKLSDIVISYVSMGCAAFIMEHCPLAE